MKDGAAPARRLDWIVVAVVVAAVVWALWLIRAIWGDGLPAGSDMGAHFVRAQVAQDEFFRHGLIDGWQARFGVGYQQSLFLGPGFSLTAIALRLATFGLIPVDVAVKATMVLSYALAPVGLATLAWAFGLGRRAVAVAALLSFGVTCTLGGAGLAGLFVWSLAPHALAAAFVLFAAAGLVRIIRRATFANVAATALCTGMVIITHPWSALVLVVFSGCLVGSAGIEWALHHRRAVRARALGAGERHRIFRSLGGVAVALAWGAAFGAVQLVPTLVHRDLKGPDEPFGDLAILLRLQAALAGEDLLRPYVALVVIAGFVFVAWRAVRSRPLALTLVLTPVLLVLTTRAARVLVPDSLFAVQLTNRALFLVGYLAVLPAAVLLGDGVGGAVDRLVAGAVMDPPAFGPAPVAGRRTGAAAVAGWVVPLVLVVVLIAVPAAPPAEHIEMAAPTPALQQAAEQIRARVAPTGRYAVQLSRDHDGERTGVWFPDFWLNWATGRNALNAYNVESALAGEPIKEVRRFAEHDADDEADRMARYGVTHVLFVEPEAVEALLSSPRFVPVWSGGDMVLAEVRGADGRDGGDGGDAAVAAVAAVPPLSAAAPVTGRVTDDDPQHVRLRVDNPVAQRVGLGTAWSPKWHLTVDGRSAPIGQDDEHVMFVDLPAGTHDLALDYQRDAADGAGALISLGAVIVLVALGVTRLRRSRRRDTPILDLSGAPPVEADAGVRGDFEAVGAEP